ncbi:S-layer homology domain-containing protein [Paenibacillus phytohabitans]|uniref:S-layer homology domain-containing protein n=1 Tax=Paenibacillus phytohabitans TaxID=2654978 RepID=UPI0014923228
MIYSDQSDISLSLDNTDGSKVQVPGSVIGEVYHSNSAHVYWAKVNGNIATGLIPGSAIVESGDTRQFNASVSGVVYSFDNKVTTPKIENHFYRFENGATTVAPFWDMESEFGVSYYNIYNNNQLIAPVWNSNYYEFYNLPYSSFQKFELSAVDLLGHESERYRYEDMYAPALLEEAEVLFSGKKKGSALMPKDGLFAFKASAQHLENDPGFEFHIFFPGAMSADYTNVPYLFDESEMDASDFELVDEIGRSYPIDHYYYYSASFGFGFNGTLNTDSKYILRLSSTASGKEIHLPDTNSRYAKLYFYLDSYYNVTPYKFSYSPHEIPIGTFPDKPTGFAATPGNGTLNLTWNSNTEADLDGYLVWLDGQLLTNSPIHQTNYLIQGLQNGKNYHVNVAAVNKDGGRSYQAYLFPAPQSVGSGTVGGGSNTGGGGSGGGGGGIASPATTGAASTPAAPVITVVDTAGVAKPLGTVLNSENGKTTVSVASDIKQLLLPAGLVPIDKNNALAVVKDDLSIQIPGGVLDQLKGLVPAEAWKDAKVSVEFSPLTSEEIAKKTDAITAKSANTIITSAGAAFEIRLSLITADGKVTGLSKLDLPVTLKLKVNAGLDGNLTGIYYLGDPGDLQYMPGHLDNGFWIAETSHFSQYAVLQYSKMFRDISASHWAAAAIQSMVAKQVVTGTSDLDFSPNQNVTRAEFAAFIARSLGLKSGSAGSFTDVTSTKWYAGEIAAAAEAGIVTGTSGSSFAPDQPITRQEMVAMLMKAYVYKNKTPLNAGEPEIKFTDYSSIAAWARPYASAAQKLGLILGQGGNKFNPLQKATRAEAVQLISKL